MERAREHLRAGRAQDALLLVRQVAEWIPDSRPVRLELARTLHLAGDSEAAARELRTLVSRPGAPPEAFNDLFVVLSGLGRADEARDALAGAPGSDLSPPELVFNRGLAALARGDLAAALQEGSRLAARPGAAALSALLTGLARSAQGDPAAAATDLRTALDDPEASWEVGYELGRALLAAARPEAATEAFAWALERGGRRWEVLLGQGHAAIASDQRELAQGLLAEAARLAPEAEVLPRIDLASALLEWGEADKACVLLRSAARQAPTDEALRLLLARAEFTAGHYEEAAQRYAETLEHDPANFRARYNLAYSLERLGRDAEAIDSYQKALQRRPGHYKTMNKLALLAVKKGDFTSAHAQAEKSLAQETEANAEGYLARGLAAKGLGRITEAGPDLEESARRDPKNPRVWRELAFVRRRLGALDAARDAAKRSLALTPEDPEALLELGLAYLETEGEDSAQKAKTAMKRALERRPGWPKALAGLAQASLGCDPPTAALAVAREAVEKGGGVRAEVAFGSALVATGDPEQAIEVLKRALVRNKGFAPGYRALANAYRASGQGDKAEKYETRYQELRGGPPSEEAISEVE